MLPRFMLLAVAGTMALSLGGHAADLHAVSASRAVIAPTSDSHLAIGGLRPLGASVIALGEGSAVVYYTHDPSRADVVRVVTTVGTAPDSAATPVRFVSYLSPGQKTEISVAGAVGTEPAVLDLAYDGDLLTVWPATARPKG